MKKSNYVKSFKLFESEDLINAAYSDNTPGGNLLDDVAKSLLDNFDFGDSDYESIATMGDGNNKILSVITDNHDLMRNETFIGEIDIMLYDDGRLKIQGTTGDSGIRDLYCTKTIASVEDYFNAVKNIDDTSLWKYED